MTLSHTATTVTLRPYTGKSLEFLFQLLDTDYCGFCPRAQDYSTALNAIKGPAYVLTLSCRMALEQLVH